MLSRYQPSPQPPGYETQIVAELHPVALMSRTSQTYCRRAQFVDQIRRAAMNDALSSFGARAPNPRDISA